MAEGHHVAHPVVLQPDAAAAQPHAEAIHEHALRVT
jgi:hypothetical protein